MANLTLWAILSGSLGACHDDQISHTRIVQAPLAPQQTPLTPQAAQPAMPPVAPAPAVAPAPPPSGDMVGEVPMPPKPVGPGGITWTLPEGWTQTLTSGIRYATLKPQVSGNIDASVVVLSGPAGGELANVNRWRSQIGLPPLAPDGLPGARKTIASKLGPLSLYDFTGEGTQKTRLVAGLLSRDETTWFFKMTGDADAVGKALPDFTKLLESLHPAS